MRAIASKFTRLLTFTRMTVAAMSISLLAPSMVFAQDVEEEPSPLAMAGDMLIARPIGVAITGVGLVLYVVSLPFSLAGGNAGEAGKALVVGPAEATFVRCLGCTQSGYKTHSDIE
jgi:hypothetical protein